MRHFVVETTYTAQGEQLAAMLPAYYSFVKSGYDKGFLLCDGPQIPGTGRILVARAPSPEALRQFLADDPLQRHGVAHLRITEFYPALRQACIESWVTHGAIEALVWAAPAADAAPTAPDQQAEAR